MALELSYKKIRLCYTILLEIILTIFHSCRKFFKRCEYHNTLPASWETCVQVKKQQLELTWNNRLVQNWKVALQDCELSAYLTYKQSYFCSVAQSHPTLWLHGLRDARLPYSSVDSGDKESAWNSGDLGSFPELGRSPGEGSGNPPQYSCQENLMDSESGGLQSLGSQRLRHN